MAAFPTVQSPNPENAEALKLAIELAKEKDADLVIATDPDCDRMGVAVRSAAGEMKLLTGNQIGSLIAYYRAKKLFEQGVLTPENASRGVIIKTFVTTDLQKAIAEKFGLRCVETLTGFKYIGAKLEKYERAAGRENERRLPRTPRGRNAPPAPRALRLLHLRRRRKLRLQRRGFRARQGRQRRRDHVLRSRGLRQVARPDDRRFARPGLTPSSVITRRKTAPSLSKARKARRKFSGFSPPMCRIRLTRCWGAR